MQVSPKLRCPKCRTTSIASYGSNQSKTIRYYRCYVCCTDLKSTKFKVLVTDPLVIPKIEIITDDEWPT